MDYLFKQFLSLPTVSFIVGGLIVVIFGYKASRSKDQKTPRWIAVGTLIGGILVLIGGIWSGINENKNIELLQSRSDQIFNLSSQNSNLSNKIAALSEQNFDLNKEHNTTLVLVTHNLQLAERTDRILLLKSGKLVEDKKTNLV